MAVVKADAYGLGATRIAPALAAAGCARFGVASIDEGIALRRALPEGEILVFSGPFAGTEPDFVAHRLAPILNSPEQIAGWAAHARSINRRLPAVDLHVDTGMSRLGLSENEARALPPTMLWRRLPADSADEPPRHAPRSPTIPSTANSSIVSPWRGACSLAFRPAWRLRRGSSSAPNGRPTGASGGRALWRQSDPGQAQSDGASGSSTRKIVQVRDIDAGRTVGYGATWRASGQGAPRHRGRRLRRWPVALARQPGQRPFWGRPECRWPVAFPWT